MMIGRRLEHLIVSRRMMMILIVLVVGVFEARPVVLASSRRSHWHLGYVFVIDLMIVGWMEMAITSMLRLMVVVWVSGPHMHGIEAASVP